MKNQKATLLGDHLLAKGSFPHLDAVFQKFREPAFLSLIHEKKKREISHILLGLIQAESEPCFLLSAVLEFIERIQKEKVLDQYTFNSFEFWLNQYSHLSFEENFHIRAKISGKKIDRSDYEALFPIGMGKIYEGTHFVTAHKSPDLDTTVASFWGWMDAFAARVSDGLHIWNLPGGPPASQIEIKWIFQDLFGPAVFTHLAQPRLQLSLSGRDLISQKKVLFKQITDSITTIDHDREHYPVVVLDPEGFYLGDWRSLDVEGVRQVISLLSSCLRWFENTLHLHFISVFVEKKPELKIIQSILKNFFHIKVEESEPALEFNWKQQREVDDFIRFVLGLDQGMSVTFDELGTFLAHFGGTSFQGLDQVLVLIKKLFNAEGELIEDRSVIFHFLQKAVGGLHESIFKIRQRLELLDVALKTKVEVFKHKPTSVTARSDLEEIRSKIDSYFSLTVVDADRDGKMFPLGVIRASDLRKKFLGTVSLRDFCNREEMSIPPYLDVISVIDHHKSSLNTFSAPMAIIADVQSSNSLVADRAFLINDRHSLGGQTADQIEKQIQKLQKESSDAAARLMQRLLKKRAALKNSSGCFIDPEREFIEYLHFLYAILDDTDLLSKVSSFDVECVASLLNRLKSLSCKQEVEIISLSDLPRDKNFAKAAAQRILCDQEMYSLYRKVYEYREKEITENLIKAANNQPNHLFSDTKEQNGCCRVGQTKIFKNNLTSFQSHKESIQRVWVDNAIEIYKKKAEVDLHIHMISTIISAEEVYHGKRESYTHQDELWFWIPQEEIAFEHLKKFLNNFQTLPNFQNTTMEIEFCGDNGDELSAIFKESFLDIPQKRSAKKLPIAVLYFKAGLLNSRKASVSPYLPSILS